MRKCRNIASYMAAALLALSSGCSQPEKHASYTVQNDAEQAAPVQVTQKYTIPVISGDISWNLARDAYGSGTLWKKLISESGINPARFNPKTDLHPGMVLCLYLTYSQAENFRKLHPERELTPIISVHFAG